jgi:GGDEF domain-containing protein
MGGRPRPCENGADVNRIVRETEAVGRYGGDEFVIVLSETSLNGTRRHMPRCTGQKSFPGTVSKSLYRNYELKNFVWIFFQ